MRSFLMKIGSGGQGDGLVRKMPHKREDETLSPRNPLRNAGYGSTHFRSQVEAARQAIEVMSPGPCSQNKK